MQHALSSPPTMLAPSRSKLGGLLLVSAVTAVVMCGAGAAYASGGAGSSSGGGSSARNVLNEPLQVCSTSPMTGFKRNGYCETGPQDFGTHTVCATVTDEFLQHTLRLGNDLVTPRPEYNFPGLKAGDGWCLCASRWREAQAAGVAPPVVLAATHEKTLETVQLQALRAASGSPGGGFRGGAGASSQ